MRCNAVLTRAQDGMDAVVPIDRRAARPGMALVAGVGGIAKVIAARALQEVPPGRRHVAELRRSPRQQRLR